MFNVDVSHLTRMHILTVLVFNVCMFEKMLVSIQTTLLLYVEVFLNLNVCEVHTKTSLSYAKTSYLKL